MQTINREVIQAIADASRTLADSLDAILNTSAWTKPPASLPLQPPSVGQTGSTSLEEPVWDPEFDVPLINPKVVGTREEQNWCILTYLGAIYAINKRYSRGADKVEVPKYARKAGYRDGRAVTSWNRGNGATQNDDDNQRWVTINGVRSVRNLAEELGVRLPDDLHEEWTAPQFGDSLRR